MQNRRESSRHFSFHCGMMAKHIVVPHGTNAVLSAAADTGCIGEVRKAPRSHGRGKDRASTREGMRNAG
jgi:hypothetical protein